MTDRNPYLILGVDFAASSDDARRAFAVAARRVRREGGAWDVSDLTWALHAIQELEAAPEDLVSIYRVPADPTVFRATSGGVFDPPPARLARATSPTTAETLSGVQACALAELDVLLVSALAAAGTIGPEGYEFEA